MSPDWLPIPGYTGHCPGVKFSVGHSYTWALLHSPQMRRANVGHVLETGGGGAVQHNDTVDEGTTARGHDLGSTTSTKQPAPASVTRIYEKIPPIRGGVSGYTGFVPGRKFVVGTNYRRSTEDCLTQHEQRTAQLRLQQQRQRRSRSLGRASAAHRQRTSPDAAGSGEIDLPDGKTDGHLRLPEISGTAASQAASKTRVGTGIFSTTGDYMSPIVPIPGYTGFVPGARSTNMSVGKTFSRFANEGFEAMHKSLSQQRLNKLAKAVKFDMPGVSSQTTYLAPTAV